MYFGHFLSTGLKDAMEANLHCRPISSAFPGKGEFVYNAAAASTLCETPTRAIVACKSFQALGQFSLYPWTQVKFDNSKEILQAAPKSSSECVYQKLSCLAVRQPARSLIGVAMAEGICVEWVSNSSVLAEVPHTDSPLSLCRSSSRAHTDSQNFGHALLLVAVQLFHL